MNPLPFVACLLLVGRSWSGKTLSSCLRLVGPAKVKDQWDYLSSADQVEGEDT